MLVFLSILPDMANKGGYKATFYMATGPLLRRPYWPCSSSFLATFLMHSRPLIFRLMSVSVCLRSH